MGTRSFIGIENEDNSVKYVYCHWNGYPSHNGKILSKNYTDRKSVNKLLEGGDMSVLKEDITDVEYYNQMKGQDPDNDAALVDNMEVFLEDIKNSWCEWVYILNKDNKWMVSSDSDWSDMKPLNEVLSEDDS